MNNELKKIKKLYGEDMMHFVRERCSTLLETDGLLLETLTKFFYPNKFLYKDLKSNYLLNKFVDYIYESIEEKERIKQVSNESPYKLMEDAGYTLYKCESEEDIQKFKKYYSKGEELCTFNGGRLNRCIVYFAVKKDVKNIKREDFTDPKREDLYGTSVISIQINRKNHVVSIKNRYNHTVYNPDATFSNNLDKIVPGLTDSFEKELGFEINKDNQNEDFDIPYYVKASDNRFYKFNYEINDIYYCPGNVIIKNFKPVFYDKSRYIVLDYMILDMQKKELINTEKDGLLSNIDINKIELKKHDVNRIICINDNIFIEINPLNKIIKYIDYYSEEIDNDFLSHNETLECVSIPNAKKIKNNFLNDSWTLKIIDLPKIESIGNNFIYANYYIESINMPYLKEVGNDFLDSWYKLKKIDFPNLRTVGNGFLSHSSNIEIVDLPELEIAGDSFLSGSSKIKQITLPNLSVAGNNFLYNDKPLLSLSLPKLKEIGYSFLHENENLKKISLPSIKKVESSFLESNRSLKKISLPKIEEIGSDFLDHNTILESINMPNVRKIGNDFLYWNDTLKNISLPNLEEVGNNFLNSDISLKSINLPKLRKAEQSFLEYNRELRFVDLPNLEVVGINFISRNYKLKKASFPSLIEIDDSFLTSALDSCDIDAPNLKYRSKVLIKR